MHDEKIKSPGEWIRDAVLEIEAQREHLKMYRDFYLDLQAQHDLLAESHRLLTIKYQEVVGKLYGRPREVL